MGRPAHLRESIENIRVRFFADPSGFQAERELSDLLDGTVGTLWERLAPSPNYAVMAVGGYGRRTLHPASDLDLLILFRDDVVESQVNEILTPLWDLGFPIGHQLRQLSDFDEFAPDHMESYTAFLDGRYLFGNGEIAGEFLGQVLPCLISKHRDRFLGCLVEMKSERYEKYAGTVFQLEPDLKSSPGGLRDFHWTSWAARALQVPAWPEGDEPVALLHRIRNFLHFMSGRHEDVLSYEYQERIAPMLGYLDSGEGQAAERLMRDYFLRAQRIASRVEVFESRILGSPDSLSVSSPTDSVPSVMDVFARAHREKKRLDAPTLERLRRNVSGFRPDEMATPPNGQAIVRMMRDRSGIYRLLRQMHAVGFLGGVFPEFESIRCRVIRDYFHKYTVDQHSLIAIRNIEDLESASGPKERSALLGVLEELRHPELLLLALLLHDIGKCGLHPTGDHASTSVDRLEGALARLDLPPAQQKLVRTAIRNHLEMSKVIMRRDLNDPEVVAGFARLVGTQEDLKMLYLLTYADMKAVSPEVWTRWKGELLWELYIRAFEFLKHDFAADRYAGVLSEPAVEDVRSHIPDVSPAELVSFLEGFPRQHLRSASPERIARYFRKYEELSGGEGAVTDWTSDGELWEVLVITRDRPFLFSRIAGALSGLGVSVVRSEAFSNSHGIAFDLFTFEDPENTLSLNPSELERFDQVLKDSVLGRTEPEKFLRRRSMSVVHQRLKAQFPVQVHFDRTLPKCTIMEIVAPDEIGLLFRISKVISAFGCDIEVALVATEGSRAIDVFYLSRDGRPLTEASETGLRQDLMAALEPSAGGREADAAVPANNAVTGSDKG